MSDAVRITVDDAALRQMLSRAPVQTRTAIGRLVQGAAIDIQSRMRVLATVGATGDLRRSIRYTYTPVMLRAEITPNIGYAQDLEEGTRPHWVSVKPGSSLRRWAQMKGINPYAVQHSIAKKGTKAHPYVQPTYDEMKPKVERDIATGIANLVGDLTVAAYNGISKLFKNALVALLDGIQYDTGGAGDKSAFNQVIDNNRGVFEGDPNVQVLPGGLLVELPTTGQSDKTPDYVVRLRIPMEDNDKSQSAAYDQMYDLTDLIIDTITAADHDGTLIASIVGGLPTGIHTLQVTATRGDWLEYPSQGGVELVCDVNVQNYYSKDLQ